jgi:hypothetical protein
MGCVAPGEKKIIHIIHYKHKALEILPELQAKQ